MLFNKEYDLICSLGGNCSAAHNLKFRNMRLYSLPFDWTYIISDKAIYNLAEGFKNNFKNFLLKANLRELSEKEVSQNGHQDKVQYEDTAAGYYWVNHFDNNINTSNSYDKVKKTFDRRINRLLSKIKNADNILFILSTNFLFEINSLEYLLNILKELYPDKHFDIKVISFSCPAEEHIISGDIEVFRYTRAINLYDFKFTNIEWQFLDNIKLKQEKNMIHRLVRKNNTKKIYDKLISVIIPAYNHEKYIQETIKSIINQTYKNIELIIVDDGSTDLTWTKINEMKEDCEKRFSRTLFETKQNEGTTKTLNRLISLAKGDYIYLIASDDIAKPQAIEFEFEFLDNNPEYALCVGNNEFIDEDGKISFWDKDKHNVYDIKKAKYKTFGDYLQERKKLKFKSKSFGTYETLYRGNYIPNGYLFRKSVFEIIPPFTDEAPLEDWYLMLQISKYFKMKYIDKILFSYRWHSSNTIKNTEKISEISDQTIIYEEKMLKQIDNSKSIINAPKILKDGVLYKRQGLPFILELFTYNKSGHKIKVVKVFNIEVKRYEKKG